MVQFCTISAWDTAIGRELFLVVNHPDTDNPQTYTLAYRFCGLSGFVDGRGRLVDAPVHLTAPDLDIPLPEDFYHQIPNAPGGQLEFTITTFENGNIVGTPYKKTVIAYADPDLCAPVLTDWNIRDVNPVSLAITEESGYLIRQLSTARCRICAQARQGATLVSARIAGVELGSGHLPDTDLDTELDLPRVDMDAVNLELTDSRGLVTRQRLPLELADYRYPTNLATVTGLTPEGEAVLTLRGQWFPGTVWGRATALTVSYRVEDGPWQRVEPELSGREYRAAVTLSGLSYTQSVRISTLVTDGLVEEALELTAKAVKPVFDWSATDFRVNVPARVAGVYMDSIYLEGSRELTLTAKDNGRQVFYLLGTCNWLGRISGILWTRAERGEAVWDGNPEVSIASQTRQTQPNGTTWVTVTLRLPDNAWDDIAIVSNKPIHAQTPEA